MDLRLSVGINLYISALKTMDTQCKVDENQGPIQDLSA